jgi:hypothetical protein
MSGKTTSCRLGVLRRAPAAPCAGGRTSSTCRASNKRARCPWRFIALAFAVALVSATTRTNAANVYFTGAMNISSTGDVQNLGTPVYAYELNNAVESVNGVTFLGSSSETALGGDVTFSGFTTGALNGNYGAFLVGTAPPATNLPGIYQQMLTGADFNSGAPVSVTLKTGH